MSRIKFAVFHCIASLLVCQATGIQTTPNKIQLFKELLDEFVKAGKWTSINRETSREMKLSFKKC